MAASAAPSRAGSDADEQAVVSAFIGTHGGNPFADDMRLEADLDLVAELAN